jgi:hypothetical protein
VETQAGRQAGTSRDRQPKGRMEGWTHKQADKYRKGMEEYLNLSKMADTLRK